MLDLKELSEEIILALNELANSSFNLCTHRAVWEKHGWVYEQNPGDEFGFRVAIPNYWPLIIDPIGKEVSCVIFPICYWESFLLRDHKTVDSHTKERLEFDQFFDSSKEKVASLLGNPKLNWQDDDKAHHSAALWEASNATLILQQACFDPQFGLEINIWLDPREISSINICTPLISELVNFGQKEHDLKGFPSLDWSNA